MGVARLFARASSLRGGGVNISLVSSLLGETFLRSRKMGFDYAYFPTRSRNNSVGVCVL